MADITQSSYLESNRFTKVIYQRGRDVCDYELNEYQDIFRVMLLRTMFNGTQNVLNGVGVLNPGSNDNGWLVVGTSAANQVNITGPGWLFCDGLPIFNSATFVQTGFTTPLAPRTDVVYLAITEVEVTDPAQIPQLGETSRRRQLSITVNISTTGLAGVPANTALEIWQGGIHYFPIASIARFTAQAAINPGDVTDLRGLLPPSLMAEITRTANHQVQALAATILETPGAGNNTLPQAAALNIDVDPENTETGGAGRTLRLRFGRDVSSFTALEVGDAHGSLGAASTEIRTPSAAMRLSDVNVKANAATSGETNIPFSSGVGVQGDQFLRMAESPILSTTATVSLLKAANARVLTVGDGTHSFGDFNGSTAIAAAVAFWQASPVIAGEALRILVKPGSYVLNNSNFINLTSAPPLEIVGMGPTQDGSVDVSISHSRNAGPSIVGSSSNIRLRNLTFVNSGVTNLVVVQSTSGVLELEGCVFRELGVKMIGNANANVFPYQMRVRDCAFRRFAGNAYTPIAIDRSEGSIANGYYFEKSYFQSANETTAVLITSSGGSLSTMGEVVFTGCIFDLGSSAASAAAWAEATNNCGLFAVRGTVAGNITLTDITFRDCTVNANTTAGANSVALYLRQPATFWSKIQRLSFIGTAFNIPASTSNVIPFYIGGTTATGTSFNNQVQYDTLIMENCFFGSTSAVGYIYGVFPTEVGNPPGVQGVAGSSSQMYIHVDSLVRMHNVRWGTANRLSGAGELCIFRPKAYDIKGLKMIAWGDGGAGAQPTHRVWLEGFTSSDGTHTADYVGSSGSVEMELRSYGLVSGALLTFSAPPASGAVVTCRPNGRLRFDNCIIEGFDNSVPTSGMFLLGVLVSELSGGGQIPANTKGLHVTDSRFSLNLHAVGIGYAGAAGSALGLYLPKISRCHFDQLLKGISLLEVAGTSGSGADAIVEMCSISNCTTIGLEAALGTGIKLMGNTFFNNNGGGGAVRQVHIGNGTGVAAVAATLFGNDVEGGVGIIWLNYALSASAVKGAETAYAATYTNGSAMIFNAAILNTP